jgi:hypothetical protein
MIRDCMSSEAHDPIPSDAGLPVGYIVPADMPRIHQLQVRALPPQRTQRGLPLNGTTLERRCRVFDVRSGEKNTGENGGEESS